VVADDELAATAPAADLANADLDRWYARLGAEARADIANGTTDARVAAAMAEVDTTSAAPISRAVSALFTMLGAVNLDAVGVALTADQMDTLTKAYEQISVAYSVAHPPSVPKPRKAAAKKVAPVKAAAKDTGGCDHPKVAGHPAKTKGLWACGLCEREVPVSAVSA
jgi:hypothetical protein